MMSVIHGGCDYWCIVPPDLAHEYLTRSSTVTACHHYTGIDMGGAWSITVTVSIKARIHWWAVGEGDWYSSQSVGEVGEGEVGEVG